MLNIVLLITCVFTILLLLLYLFYWNRVLALVISILLRIAFWNQAESSIWLDIGSIQFSVIAGRIAFKDLRYYSSNQTIRVVKGQISWRYWIRRPAEEDDLSHTHVLGEDLKQTVHLPLSCRVHLSLQGFEWFIYNRTASYENILSQMADEIPPTPAPTPVAQSVGMDARGALRKIFSKTSTMTGRGHGPSLSLASSLYLKTPSYLKRFVSWVRLQLPNFDPKNLLPMGLEVSKGAIICGNASTPNLLIAEFSEAQGTYGIVQARSKYDLYKQLLNLQFENASIHYFENADFDAHMGEVGSKLREHIERSGETYLKNSGFLSYAYYSKLWNRLKLWSFEAAPHPRPRSFLQRLLRQRVPVPHPPTSWAWWRPNKTLDEETPIGIDFSTLEYAIERKILEAPTLEFLYYADVVGVVPAENSQQPTDSHNLDPFDIGNGDLPPEWGIDFVVKGGFLRYGPWADRQRSVLQSCFFPSTFRSVEPAARLKPGDMRTWTGLKVFIELRDGVTLHVPFREASKDWQWDGLVDIPDRPRKREAAFIHVKAGDSSTITYIMPMVASATGYDPLLEVHLDTVTVTSSLNDMRLLTAQSCRIRCQLPTPLKWNGERTWTFSILLRSTQLFLLRDHINMLTDLGKDWSSGPPSDFYRFIPMHYVVELDLHDYEVNTYVNDHNIIDKPLIKEDNSILALHGLRLSTVIQIPLTRFRPSDTTVSFRLEAPDVSVRLTLPRWNTYSLSPSPDRSNIGRIGLLTLDGSYRYHADVRDYNIDQLKLDFAAKDIVYKAFGWTIRHFMVLRDNYFGSFTHFCTLSEYLEKRRKGQPIIDPIELQWRPGKSNALEVEVGFYVNNGLIVLPAGLPGFEHCGPVDKGQIAENDHGSCLILNCPALQVQLRTNDYFMEMSLNVDTLFGDVESCSTDQLLFHRLHERDLSSSTIVLDELDITANRLFGPHPKTATYVCIWEIHLGSVKACLSAHQARVLSAASDSFSVNFSDPLNAPAKEFALPVDPDVTFLKVTLGSVFLVWLASDSAVELALPDGLRFDSNDLAGQSYMKVTSVRIPTGSIKALNQTRERSKDWHDTAGLTFDMHIDTYAAPPGWREKAEQQRAFVNAQDYLTSRASCLYAQGDADSMRHTLPSGRGAVDNDIYLPQLRVPYRRAQGWSKSQRMLRPATNLGVPHFQPTAPASLVSESEGDDGYSEVARDARVANSRLPGTPKRPSQTTEEDSLLSGDESDDEDLSESGDWDSDDSLESNLGTERPMVSRYREHLGHYKAPFVRRPVMWDYDPFTPSTRPRVPWRQHSRRSARDLNAPPRCDMPYSVQPNDEKQLDTTIIRLSCSRGCDIWVTPVVLQTVDALVEDLSCMPSTPELRFDSMMVEYIRSSLHASDPVRKRFTIDATVCSLTVAYGQFIAMDTQCQNACSVLGTSSTEGSQSEAFSTLQVSLQNTTLGYNRTDKPGADDSSGQLRASFRRLSVALVGSDSPQDKRTTYSRKGSYDSPIVIGINIAPSVASQAPGQFTLSLGDAVLDVAEHALHFTNRFVMSTNSYLRGALELRKKYVAHHMPSIARLIAYQVLKYSRRRTVVDPLSTIQPSYLVQKGLPDELRRSSCFKFLVYLRSCLRSLEATERRDVLHIRPSTIHPEVSMRDLYTLLENQDFGQTVDDDNASLPRHPFMDKLFDISRAQVAEAPKHEFPSPMSGLLRLGVLSLTVSHDAGDDKSTLAVGPLDANAHMEHCSFLPTPHVSAGKSYGNLAATDKGAKDLLRIASFIKLQRFDVVITPRMVVLVSNAMRLLERVSKMHTAKAVPQPGSPASPAAALLSGAYLDLAFTLESARFAAAAEQLLVELSVSRLGFATATLSKPRVATASDAQYSMNHSLLVDETALRVRPWSHVVTPKGRSTLASFLIHRSRMNIALCKEPHQPFVLRVVSCVDNVEFTVPRSALNLYRSLDDWKEAYLSNILPHQPNPSSAVSMKREGKDVQGALQLRFSLQLFCGAAGVTLQVARGTWFSWKVKETAVDLASSDHTDQILPVAFGLQAGPHAIGISTRAPSKTSEASASNIEVELPMVTLKGTYSTNAVHGISLVETFHLTVRPADWDTLLSVYQKSEQGFNDLVHLIQETRPRSRPTAAPSGTRGGLNLSGSFRMKGFRIGVEGHSSTVFLECDDIGGSMGSQADLGWQIRLSDLSLSLASRASSRSALDRGHRSAFVTIDFEANMKCIASRRHVLEVLASKVHAVMQPTSIGELSDFADSLQAEVFARQADRAQELAQFKEKTKNIMRSFDVKYGNANDQQKSWLDQYDIYLSVRHIGVAFPLAAFPDLQMSRSGSRDDTNAVRAFLFSIKSLDFGTEHGESGDATMKGFSFQFVSRFRQSVSADFGGENHITQNRMLYPQMTAQARSDRIGGTRRLRIAANVSGFILDLDPSIPFYVFSLVDVYRQGRERMDQLASNIPWSSDKTQTVKPVAPPVEESRPDALPSSNILLALTFASGKVRMHSTSLSEIPTRHRKTSGMSERLHDYASDTGVETFDLPVVTVWGEYRANTGTKRTLSGKQRLEPSVLMFKATIHSSQNTLRPTLLPFVTKIVSHVENRLRQSSRPLSQISPTSVQHFISDSTGLESVPDPVDPVSGLKISLCLRIDQSKLELTCQPDVNVIAGLHWDSGGFIVNMSPGFRRVSFTGSVAGLTVGLKHGFLSEDCVKLDARNLTFNVTFAKTDVGSEKVISSISVVVDTEFSGGLRFSRLQDVLCFKAVWLDRIPVLSGPVATPMTPEGPAAPTTQRSVPSGQELTTAVLLRFRRVNLDADLGQSISYISLRIENMLVRTKLSDTYSELTLAIAQFKVLASGNVSGQVTAPDFEFQTIRHSEGKDGGFAGGRMLDLTMRSGVFNVDLESEYQKLIQYRAEPVEVKIYDDWSMISQSVAPEERHVNVTFTVSGTEVIIVMNVGTIPKLVSYADKFKATLDSQRDGASKESKAFRIANSPKPDNPLSAVANAMLKSTRSRLREETGVNYKIGQRMSLRLDVLRLVVFPRSMRDAELAQFVGRDVHARLDRMVEVTALPAKRDLELSFSSISTSRISQLNHALLAKETVEDSKQWLTTLMKDAPEATIFGLPSMDIRMSSEEDLVLDRRTLVYDFSSKFTVKEGAKNREDIYITLNMSLYTWLTSLRKAFTREMQQVQASGDVRGSPMAIVQQAASSRKRAAEAAVAAMRVDKDSEEPASSTQPSGRPPLSRAATLAISPSRANSPTSPTFSIPGSPMSPMRLTSPTSGSFDPIGLSVPPTPGKVGLVYEPRERHIERLTMRQLGEATPDVMHPFFMKKAGFSLEDSLPQYVHEYATMPTEEIMKALLKLYSKQLTSNQKDEPVVSI